MIKENEMNKFFNNKLSTSVSSVESVTTNEIIASRKYIDYYDVSNTIATAGATDPNDFDSTVYNREQIFIQNNRNAEKLLVKNDGSDTLYVTLSHIGGLSWSKEVPIYPGEVKTYYNVYEVRLRSPTAGNAYRVMEYHLCCNDIAGTTTIVPSSTSMIVGEKTNISNVASQIIVASTLIYKAVTVKVRSLGTGSYIGFGDLTTQVFQLTAVDQELIVDFTDNLNKLYVITDAGNTGAVEWIGA